ncbi:MAG: LysM peptidoglycan-binding domain-containing protein [Verrucomicrobiales bacterium]|nr:LysM peptidoglycan-binding domain-containing protein [Verrucomicrobiales bacterium]
MKRIATLAVIAFAVLASVVADAEERYTVSSGDTLSKIGRQFGIPYQDIMTANNLSSHRIFVGQVLLIPSREAVAEVRAQVLDKPALYPTYDRYRTQELIPPPEVLLEKSEEPVDRVGLASGEVPLFAPSIENEPEAFAKPLFTYPSPTQERFASPGTPVEVNGVSPYNDSGPASNAPQTSDNSGKGLRAVRDVPISANRGTYIVQPGDTVRSISREFGINFWELRSANQLRFKKVYPGQVLKIPGQAFHSKSLKISPF